MVALLVIVAFGVLLLLRRRDRRELAELRWTVEYLQERVAAGTHDPAPPAASSVESPRSVDGALRARSVGERISAIGEPEVAPLTGPFDDAGQRPGQPGPHRRRQARHDRLVAGLKRSLAEHALALVGGLFVVIAASLFVTIAIDRGWLGPAARMVLAGLFGAALLLAAGRAVSGLGPTERRGRAIGSLHGVLAGSGVAVLFLTIVASTRRYDLLGAPVALLLLVAVGALCVEIARRWRSQDLAAFGVVGALASPLLADAPAAGSTVAVLAVAIAMAGLVSVIEVWPRLLLVSLLVTAPQLADYISSSAIPIVGFSAVVAAWWALHLGAAAGVTARTRGLRRSAVSVVFALAASVPVLYQAWGGDESAAGDTRAWWLAGAAVAHLLVAGGLVMIRRRFLDLAALLGAAGGLLAAYAIGDGTDGGTATVGWALEAAALTHIWWRLRDRWSAAAAVALGAMAVLHCALGEGDIGSTLPWSSRDIRDSVVGVGALLVAAAAARAVARWRADPTAHASDGPVLRVLDAVAVVAAWDIVAMLGVRLLTGVAGVPASDDARVWLAAWLLAGALAAVIGGVRTDRAEIALIGGVAALGSPGVLAADGSLHTSALAVFVPAALITTLVAHHVRVTPMLLLLAWLELVAGGIVISVATPPRVLVLGSHSSAVLHVVQVLLLLTPVVVALGAARVAPRSGGPGLLDWPGRMAAAAAITAWYALSAGIAAALTSSPGHVDQDAQVVLSVTWAALGVAALIGAVVVARRRSSAAARTVRAAGYTLLAIAAVKTVTFDTAQLEAAARVLVFLGVGVLLLGAAGLEQRMRRVD